MWSTYLTMVSHLVRKSKKRTQKLHQDPSPACEQVSLKASKLSASYGSQMALNRSRSANIILPCMSDMGHSCRTRVCKCHDVLIACSCHGAPLCADFIENFSTCSLSLAALLKLLTFCMFGTNTDKVGQFRRNPSVSVGQSGQEGIPVCDLTALTGHASSSTLKRPQLKLNTFFFSF